MLYIATSLSSSLISFPIRLTISTFHSKVIRALENEIRKMKIIFELGDQMVSDAGPSIGGSISDL